MISMLISILVVGLLASAAIARQKRLSKARLRIVQDKQTQEIKHDKNKI